MDIGLQPPFNAKTIFSKRENNKKCITEAAAANGRVVFGNICKCAMRHTMQTHELWRFHLRAADPRHNRNFHINILRLYRYGDKYGAITNTAGDRFVYVPRIFC